MDIVEEIYEIGKLFNYSFYLNPYFEFSGDDIIDHQLNIMKKKLQNPEIDLSDTILKDKFSNSFTGVLKKKTKGIIKDELPNENYVKFKKDYLHVGISDYSGSDIKSIIDKTVENLSSAKGIILDLRYQSGVKDNLIELLKEANFFNHFYENELENPALLDISYNGFPSLFHYNNDTYNKNFSFRSQSKFEEGCADKHTDLVILLNEESIVLPVFFALQSNKKAIILSNSYINTSETNVLGIYKSKDIKVAYHNQLLVNSNMLAVPAFYYHNVSNSELSNIAFNILKKFQSFSWDFFKIDLFKVHEIVKISEKLKTLEYKSKHEQCFFISHLHTVFTYFYPLFDFCKSDWDIKIKEALKAIIYTTDDDVDFERLIKELLSNFPDGHIFVSTKSYFDNHNAILPFKLAIVNETLIITELIDCNYCLSKGIEVGDEVMELNGLNLNEIHDKVKTTTSNSNQQNLKSNILNEIHRGKISATAKIKLVKNCKEKQIEIIYDKYKKTKEQPAFKIMNDNSFYINLTKANQEELDNCIAEINSYENVILDLRDYPSSNPLRLLKSLAKKKRSQWADIEVKTVNTSHLGNSLEKVSSFKRIKSYFSCENADNNIKVYVLCSHDSLSWSESIVGFLRDECSATVIGSKTSGTNGDYSVLNLGKKITIYFTGLRSYYKDGSLENMAGIKPDIEVNYNCKEDVYDGDIVLKKIEEILEGKK